MRTASASVGLLPCSAAKAKAAAVPAMTSQAVGRSSGGGGGSGGGGSGGGGGGGGAALWLLEAKAFPDDERGAEARSVRFWLRPGAYSVGRSAAQADVDVVDDKSISRWAGGGDGAATGQRGMLWAG